MKEWLPIVVLLKFALMVPGPESAVRTGLIPVPLLHVVNSDTLPHVLVRFVHYVTFNLQRRPSSLFIDNFVYFTFFVNVS